MLMVVPTLDESVILNNALLPDCQVVVEVSLGLSHILKLMPKSVGAHGGVVLKALALRPAVKQDAEQVLSLVIGRLQC